MVSARAFLSVDSPCLIRRVVSGCRPDTHLLETTPSFAFGDAQKRFARERIAALLEDRTLREADAVALAASADAKLADLAARLADAETVLLQTTKDHVLGACCLADLDSHAVNQESRHCGPVLGCGFTQECKSLVMFCHQDAPDADSRDFCPA